MMLMFVAVLVFTQVFTLLSRTHTRTHACARHPRPCYPRPHHPFS